MTKITEGFIPVTGGNVWYRKTGDGEGIPLLVMHGGPGSSTMASDSIQTLGEQRPVIHYDQLGSGKSDRPTDPSLWKVERFVEELGQVRSALGLTEVHLLGHSWGTMLAAAYLLGFANGSLVDGTVKREHGETTLAMPTKPVGVHSVTFSSPALSAPMWERDQRAYLKAFPQHVQNVIERCEREGTTDSEAYQDAMMLFYKRHVCRLDPWPQTILDAFAVTNHQVYQTMWGASEFTVTGTLKTFDVTGRLSELTLPSLFTCGRYDEATPETTAYYASLVAGARFHVFEHSAHMTIQEEPEEFARILKAFLKDVEAENS